MTTQSEIEEFYELPRHRLSQIKGSHQRDFLSYKEVIKIHELTGMTTEYLRTVKGAKLYDFLVGYYSNK